MSATFASGNPNYYDDRAAAADAQARMAQVYAAEFIAALDRGNPLARLDSGLQHDATLVDVLADSFYTDELAVKFVEGMCLLRGGKYEAACKALLAWQYLVATKHAVNTAELRGAE